MASIAKSGKRYGTVLATAVFVLTLQACGDANDVESEGSSGDRSDWPTGINIGASSQGTASYTVAAGLSDVLGSELDVSATPLATGYGSNISLVAQGEAQMGMVWPYSTFQALEGEGAFADADIPVENIRLLNAGTFFPGGIVVLADSGYESIEDLRGKRILAERTVSPDTTVMVRALLEGGGLEEGDYETLSYEGCDDAVPALVDGSADAFGYITDVEAACIVEMDELHGIRILGMSEEQQQEIMPDYPWLSPYVIPEGALSGQNKDAYVVQDQTLMVVNADLPESFVYELLKTLVKQREALGEYHPTGSEWFDPETMLNVGGIPYHEGAIRFYEEEGMWSEEHQAQQEEALDALP